MPTFIPPTEIIETGIVNAEKKLYLALKDQLGDDYTVFHSLEWVSTRGDFQPLGEIDFLIFHPEMGILVCEVKGGVVFRRDGSGPGQENALPLFQRPPGLIRCAGA